MKISRVSVRSAIEAVLSFEKKTADVVSVSFVSDTLMKRYHRQFFGDASSTDCISLPLDADFNQDLPFRYLGEIIICPKTALHYVKKDINGFWRELTLYLVHGMLHLLGYDDTTQPQKTTMKQRERKAMALLLKKGLLLTGSFRLST